MNTIKNTHGFTIIEALVAMVVLTIGILALYSMQVSAVRGNATANGMTMATNWGADQVERLLATDFDDPVLRDDNDITDLAAGAADGIAGLDAKTDAAADGKAVSVDGRYTIYWNIADFVTPDPSNLTDSTVKAVRIIVLHRDRLVQKEVVLDYYKQKLF